MKQVITEEERTQLTKEFNNILKNDINPIERLLNTVTGFLIHKLNEEKDEQSNTDNI